MKNIHVLPTDKPSRLYKTGDFLLLDSKAIPNNALETKNQHIYITSDEEIKANEWFYSPNTNSPQVYGHNDIPKDRGFKKIILTTDQELIKDGVQAIDDEFLEWFIKNPSCKSVEVLEAPKLVKMIDNEFYKIFISKEEPKQETLEEELLQQIKFCLICKNDSQAIRLIEKYGFQKQERMYSEEEVINILIKFNDCSFDFDFDSEVEDWFEQFKNK